MLLFECFGLVRDLETEFISYIEYFVFLSLDGRELGARGK